jgi:hypothetical protein
MISRRTTASRLSERSSEWDWLSPLWLRARYALVEKDEEPASTDQQRRFPHHRQLRAAVHGQRTLELDEGDTCRQK